MRVRRLVALSVAALLGVAVWGTVVAFGVAGSSDDAHFAELNGGPEVGPNGEAGAGDPNGYGGATVAVRGRYVCFGLAWHGLAKVVAAHIHRGEAGENGPVVVDFGVPSAGLPGTRGSHSGCVRVARALARDIDNNPGAFYVNVHTTEIPAGAIRDQLG